jgi:hypothetical protein
VVVDATVVVGATVVVVGATVVVVGATVVVVGATVVVVGATVVVVVVVVVGQANPYVPSNCMPREGFVELETQVKQPHPPRPTRFPRPR